MDAIGMEHTLAPFVIAGAIAVASAVGVVVARNSVHSAVFLALNFFCLAILYLLLHAEFLFYVQIAVYAGAIMVLFLFVVMLIRVRTEGTEEDELRWQKPVAVALAVVLIGQAIVVARAVAAEGTKPMPQVAASFGRVEAIGKLLLTKYLLPFELTSILLLVAILGAVVLARKEESE
jgi:NADH-quinone oxidoreductase subunit J